MCELLIRVTDKTPATGHPSRDQYRSVRGEVIFAAPEGSYWGPGDRGNPEWRIVRVPGMTVDEGRSMMMSEPSGVSVVKHRGRPRKYYHKRYFVLDLDALLIPDGWLPTLDANAVRAARQAKPPLLNQR